MYDFIVKEFSFSISVNLFLRRPFTSVTMIKKTCERQSRKIYLVHLGLEHTNLVLSLRCAKYDTTAHFKSFNLFVISQLLGT